MNSQLKEIILFCETPEYHFIIYDLFQFEIVVALILCKTRIEKKRFALSYKYEELFS